MSETTFDGTLISSMSFETLAFEDLSATRLTATSAVERTIPWKRSDSSRALWHATDELNLVPYATSGSQTRLSVQNESEHIPAD